MTYFKAKISYLKQTDNGSIIKVSETFIVTAYSFTEAEANLLTFLEEYIPEYNLKALSVANIDEVVLDESFSSFFEVKISYVSFNEDTGKESKINETFLVQAEDIDQAGDIMRERLKGSIVDWEMSKISKTNILDVFIVKDEQIS